ncbi:hypothetical protein ASPSYDRAFT_193722, partial [Aspergillus sydowii CBS 593.65]
SYTALKPAGSLKPLVCTRCCWAIAAIVPQPLTACHSPVHTGDCYIDRRFPRYYRPHRPPIALSAAPNSQGRPDL